MRSTAQVRLSLDIATIARRATLANRRRKFSSTLAVGDLLMFNLVKQLLLVTKLEGQREQAFVSQSTQRYMPS
ncbi:MAG: hypothetical protein JOZ78_01740 [Chroococcidiopsidaceae cyanobacterium CP_BM_ER_R8_30]|nr:hypothetical protein [Chroococcidiopsidaceae cyanobacterium CP_BM_ER_R8_30]